MDGYNGELMTVDAFQSATVYSLTGTTQVDVCDKTTFPLTAGQYNLVGNVEVFNDATNLYITYTTTQDFGTLHLWVGKDLTLLPKNKSGIPVPGKFPYKYDATNLEAYTFTLPLASL